MEHAMKHNYAYTHWPVINPLPIAIKHDVAPIKLKTVDWPKFVIGSVSLVIIICAWIALIR
jgi:hypothetical protein